MKAGFCLRGTATMESGAKYGLAGEGTHGDCVLAQVFAIKEDLEVKDMEYPHYYLQAFHAYEEGNLNWLAAFEVEAATAAMAIRTFAKEGLGPQEAQDLLRANIHALIQVLRPLIPPFLPLRTLLFGRVCPRAKGLLVASAHTELPLIVCVDKCKCPGSASPPGVILLSFSLSVLHSHGMCGKRTCNALLICLKHFQEMFGEINLRFTYFRDARKLLDERDFQDVKWVESSPNHGNHNRKARTGYACRPVICRAWLMHHGDAYWSNFMTNLFFIPLGSCTRSLLPKDTH